MGLLAMALRRQKHVAGKGAYWMWSVEVGVPPTELSRKGGDDRNPSLYFIFAPQDVAVAVEGMGIRKLMENPDIRVLMYVWGGGARPG